MNASPKEPEVPATQNVAAVVLQRIAAILRVNPQLIELDSDFGTLGFDSMALTQLCESLNEPYGIDLVPPILFEYSTPRRLAEFLVAEYPAQFSCVASAGSFGVQAAVSAARLPDSGPAAIRADGAPAADPGAACEPIAVIGMSARFPKAADVDAFWKNLLDGLDCVDEIPAERWDWRPVYGPATQRGKTNVKWAGCIQGIEEFDPRFFGLSPRDALLTDPQHRLLMQHVWNCVEDAGYSPRSLSGSRTGIFIGLADTGYTDLLAEHEVRSDGFSFGGRLPSIGVNRLSYLLDLHGPSEPVDSSCSSALVAVHRGVQAILSGECDTAIVGGVSLLLLRKLHVYLSNAGLLGGDGRCKTFSRYADGYGRGEGVGIVLLKRLAAAERDGDHIYALIRGSGENHGGRAGSLTAPNPVAQADLIVQTYHRAGIDPRSVGYIETHGTGTALGDPIEINGLKSAFAQLGVGACESDESPFCGLGSVKTNIGHLEPAAGIAGLIKVILQLVHGKIVRTLHCEEPNPFIQLEGSPFYIVKEARDWKPLPDVSGSPMPRRGGVSSFGIGGVNAHVVLEEYIRPPVEVRSIRTRRAPLLVVISARDERGLQARVEDLLRFLRDGSVREHALPAIAYTLQAGREAMEQRLALCVNNLTELQDKLTRFLDGDEHHGCCRGEAKRHKEAMAVLNEDDDAQRLTAAWIERGKFTKLLELWVKGLGVDWSLLYPHGPPGRARLPGYPFAKERYWPVSNADGARSPLEREGLIGRLHPLVHRNISTLSQTRFRSRFIGNEPWLADCVVQGARTLPAAAHLEMACAALRQASEEPGTAMRITDVVWAEPIAPGKTALEVSIELFPQEMGRVGYEIRSTPEGAVDDTVHCQGTVTWLSVRELPKCDLHELREQCANERTEAQEEYERLQARGLEYGPAYRSLQSISRGIDRTGKVLAHATIRIPDVTADAHEQYTIHPSLLEIALQVGLGFASTAGIAMPVTADSIDVLARCPSQVVACVRGDVAAQRVDVDLCDEGGTVHVRVSGLRARVQAQQPRSQPAPARPATARRWVLLCEGLARAAGCSDAPTLEETCERALLEQGTAVRRLRSSSSDKQAEQRFEAYTLQLFELLQEILKSGTHGDVLLQLVADVRAEPDLCAGLIALLRSSALEHPRIRTETITVAAGETCDTLLQKLAAAA